MAEIARIIAYVLSNTKPATITKGDKAGQLSKAKAITPPEVIKKAMADVQSLLARFVLYPELDLALLQANFSIQA
ncbi:MAG: hypothetical protein CVV52_12500 [Spirochaetae bacterium HGW-Spirochaetae-8]|nr:MAG: hypothetical protein CVV52_12500 [Spirochaetae bacterium HGW-Spirochaetae-8]